MLEREQVEKLCGCARSGLLQKKQETSKTSLSRLGQKSFGHSFCRYKMSFLIRDFLNSREDANSKHAGVYSLNAKPSKEHQNYGLVMTVPV